MINYIIGYTFMALSIFFAVRNELVYAVKMKVLHEEGLKKFDLLPDSLTMLLMVWAWKRESFFKKSKDMTEG